MSHLLYKDGDPDIPRAICDSNGQVVLGLCRICNAAEAELETSGCTDEIISRLEDKHDGPEVRATVRLINRMRKIINHDHKAEL